VRARGVLQRTIGLLQTRYAQSMRELQFGPYSSHETVSSQADGDWLGELGRVTTAYHEATPDRLENARQEYERVLRCFKQANSPSLDIETT